MTIHNQTADSGHRPDKSITMPKPGVAKGVNRGFIALPLALLMAGCQTLGITNPAPTAAADLYAVISGYTEADNLAAAYEHSTVANPAIVAEIKQQEAATYSVVLPIINSAASGGSAVSATEIAAGQAAVTAFSNFLASKGIK